MNSSQLPTLNGIRVMSLGWVILGHFILIFILSSDNPLYALYRSENLLIQAITNGTPSVDSFFVMGGMLVMLGGLKALDKHNGNPYKDVKFWSLYYLHRLIRLWPTLLLTLLFIVGIYPNLAPFFYSPVYTSDNPESLTALCSGSKWLSAAFFYNNLVNDPVHVCMGELNFVNTGGAGQLSKSISSRKRFQSQQSRNYDFTAL